MASTFEGFEFKPSRMRDSRTRESLNLSFSNVKASRMRDSLNLSSAAIKPSRTKGASTGKQVQFSSQTNQIWRNGVDPSVEFFSKLPPESEWLRSGMVERQTSIADAVWQPRLIVLTATDVLFAKADSDAIVDRLPLRSISFVGQVLQI